MLAALFSEDIPDRFGALKLYGEQLGRLTNAYVLILQYEVDQNGPLLVADSRVVSFASRGARFFLNFLTTVNHCKIYISKSENYYKIRLLFMT